MSKRLFFIFIIAFFLNFIWEELHSQLYTHYKGESITHLVLVYAALFDAFVIFIAAVLFFYISILRDRISIIFLILIIFAIGLEIFALETGRWQYNSFMPIIPALGVGFTPTIQLGLLAYFSIRISSWVD
ncbi:MAG: hypothetical protein AAB783_01045 [Patescibacteria group bacterium]